MEEIDAWVGLDVGKGDHHATVVDAAGRVLLDRGVRNDEQAIEKLLDDAGPGAALVVDQPGSIGTLAVAVARRRAIRVAYVPGLVMRRASELYPGEAKTDRRDSFVIADTARIHQARLHWLTAGDELLEELRVLGGYDDDLAHDRTRAANRLRDMLLQAAPALERVLGPRLEHPAVRALLERYPTPSAMCDAGRRRLIRIVQPRAHPTRRRRDRRARGADGRGSRRARDRPRHPRPRDRAHAPRRGTRDTRRGDRLLRLTACPESGR